MFPVSVKAVLIVDGKVVLLENERREWELPGGRLEAGESPQECLRREVMEELAADVRVGAILDCWLYEVLPGREVVIVTYAVERIDSGPLAISEEHKRVGLFSPADIDALPMPEGYRRSIRAWAGRRADPGGQA